MKLKNLNFRHVVNTLKMRYYQKRQPDTPWLPADCIDFLRQYLRSEDILLETGSGRSTIWFSKRVREVISIEHDLPFYNMILSQIEKSGRKNIQYFHETIEYVQSQNDSKYIKKVESFSDKFFDAVLVDGKHRSHVALVALNKVKSNGIIIIDNVERYLPTHVKLVESLENSEHLTPEWRDFDTKTSQKRKVIFTNGLTSTIIVFM